jgi:toxin ParE1/3/4
MKSVKYARRANADLEGITDYTARTWGAEQAKKYNRDIQAKMQEIAKGEASIQPLDVSKARMFKARVNRHLIIFEQTDEHILIVRVLHEAMDIPHLVSPPY